MKIFAFKCIKHNAVFGSVLALVAHFVAEHNWPLEKIKKAMESSNEP